MESDDYFVAERRDINREKTEKLSDIDRAMYALAGKCEECHKRITGHMGHDVGCSRYFYYLIDRIYVIRKPIKYRKQNEDIDSRK